MPTVDKFNLRSSHLKRESIGGFNYAAVQIIPRRKRLDVRLVRIVRFEEIREAHRVMEANEVYGKMVVVHA
jgi:hypothetical protein